MTVIDLLRDELADYTVLEAFALERRLYYGDMAGGRRWRELNRRSDALLRAGAAIDADGEFVVDPPFELDELAAAWDRVVEPRRRRFERSLEPLVIDGQEYSRITKHARATRKAYAGARVRIGLDR